jgi:hypothetical protein
MSDPAIVPKLDSDLLKDAALAGEVSAKELEKLAPETKTIMSLFAAIVRNYSGPDPATAKIVAESEMHEETCKLEGYKESCRVRDLQNERDHKFRVKRLNHETAKGMIVTVVCVIGILAGLYLLVERQEHTLGSDILIASFLGLLGGRSLLPKEKD